MTPEAVVYRPRPAHLLYEGRIDDRFPDFGRERDIATVQDLRRALDALRAGLTGARRVWHQGRRLRHPVTD